MSKEAYWDGLCGRNPALAKQGGKVSLDVEKLRAIVFQAYERGASETHGRDTGSRHASKDMFDALFGGRG